MKQLTIPLAVLALSFGVLLPEVSSAAVCRSTDSKDQGEDFGWAGSLSIDFELEGQSLKNVEVGVDYDQSAGVTGPDSVSIDEIKAESGSLYSKSSAWKNSTAFRYTLGNGAEYVLLLKIEAGLVQEAARVKALSGSEEIRLNCEE